MQLYSAGTNILRDTNLEPNPLNANAEEPTILLEYYSRNGLQNSEGGAPSTGTSFATVTQNFATAPDGTSTAFQIKEDNNNVYHSASWLPQNTANGNVNSATVFAKAGLRTKCWVDDQNSAGGDPCIIDLTTGSIVSGPVTATVKVTPAGNGWYKIDRTWTYGASHNNIALGCVNGAGAISYAGDGTSYILAWRVCDWMNRANASSPVLSLANQAGSPVPAGFPDTSPTEFNYGTGRYLDSALQIPFASKPQAMSGLIEFIEKGTSKTSSAGIWSIGDYVLTSPSLQLGTGSTGYQIKHTNEGSVSSVLAAFPTIGQLVRLRWTLRADGSVQIWQSINGAAEVAASSSATSSLAVAWSEGYSWLNGLGAGNQGFIAYRQSVVLPGADISQADLLSHFT